MNTLPKGCKPFDLQKALAGAKVVDYGGDIAQKVVYNPDAPADCRVVVWFLNGNCYLFTDDGKIGVGSRTPSLYLAVEKKTLWVNVYRNPEGGYTPSNTHETEAIAKASADMSEFGSPRSYVCTSPVEVVE